MLLLKKLLQALFKSYPEDKLGNPTSTKRITIQRAYEILRAKYPGDTQLYLSDVDFLLCNEKDIERFLKQDTTNKMGYVTEVRDCDDFSYRLMGQLSIPGWSDLAFGIVWTDAHALNCFIDESEKFWFVEPQTDEILEETKDWMGNQIRFIVM